MSGEKNVFSSIKKKWKIWQAQNYMFGSLSNTDDKLGVLNLSSFEVQTFIRP